MILYHPAQIGTGREESGAAVPMRHPRLAMALPVVFVGDHGAGQGMTGDLSWSGCAVAAGVSMPVGTYLRLQLEFEQGAIARVPVDLARVRWSSNGRFGVEFIKIDRVDQARLRSLVISVPTTSLSS
jgi:PilZ domain